MISYLQGKKYFSVANNLVARLSEAIGIILYASFMFQSQLQYDPCR